jgi:hypothetical protein
VLQLQLQLQPQLQLQLQEPQLSTSGLGELTDCVSELLFSASPEFATPVVTAGLPIASGAAPANWKRTAVQARTNRVSR